MKSILPLITWQTIAPPYYEYEYFQESECYPFRSTSESFDLVNAWWLCEAATLVYAEEEFVRLRFQQTGLPEVKYFSGASTQCFVASNDAYIFVVFRGTEIRRRAEAEDFQNIIADIKADSNIMLVDSGHGKGKIHKGFNDALDEVWEALVAYLKNIHIPDRTLWFTGHSLGAALATLAAARYGNVHGLYTFGSPRVGDHTFKKFFSVRTYRVVNNNDIVTTVPPPGLYRHVGELWYIDGEGLLYHNPRRTEMWTDNIRSEMRNIANSIDQARQGSFGFIPGGIKDHVPILYAIHLWNNIQIRE